ncbi:MAG: hypothetical protein GX541_00080 [Clostridiales bacterium]|nr:hypothetical protein [Clostridiales bacterium]
MIEARSMAAESASTAAPSHTDKSGKTEVINKYSAKTHLIRIPSRTTAAKARSSLKLIRFRR